MKLATKLKNSTHSVLTTVRAAFRGKLNMTKSANGIQSMQIDGLNGETIVDAENYQQFGFTSNPPSGTKVIVLPLGGATSHSVIIATENASFRVAGLKGGETAIYDQSGSTIVLKNGKIIEIDCDEIIIKTKKYTCSADTITLDAPMTIITGGLTAGGSPKRSKAASDYTATFNIPVIFGQITTMPDAKIGGRLYSVHAHIDSIGGNTKPPN